MFSSQESHIKSFKIAGFVIVILLSILLFYQSDHKQTPYKSKPSPIDKQMRLFVDRTKAPDFKWKTPGISKESLQGKVVYFNFWAQWCEPCKTEMPLLDKLYNEFKEENQNIKIVLVNVDTPGDVHKAIAFAEDLAPSVPKIYGDHNFEKMLSLQFLPYHLLIDKNGMVAGEFYGDIIDLPNEFKEMLVTLEQEN